MKRQIDMLPFLLEAFGENRRLYRDIDLLYAKDKYTYYKTAKLSPLYNHPIICEGNILRQEYGRKMLGILLSCTTNNPALIEDVFNLIKKGWPYIYRLVEKEMDKSDTIDVFNIISKAYSREDYLSLPDDVICSIVTVILFLTANFGKKIAPKGEEVIANIYASRLSFYSSEAKERLSYKNITPEIRRKIDTLKKDIFKKTGVIKNFRDINPSKDEQINRLNDGFALVFDTEYLSAPSLFDVQTFQDKDIDEILTAYFISHRNLNATKAVKFLTAGMYIKYLLKSYKEAKEHYFKYNRETMFVTLELHEKEIASLREKNTHLNERVQKQMETIDALKKDLEVEYSKARNEFIKKIQELEKENEQLKAELEADKNELVALRELAFSLEQEPQPESETGLFFDDVCRAVNLPSVLIVGGHPAWQKQIKDKLPDATFVSADMLGFDPNTLGDVWLVVFNTAYLNHAMYYKIINFVRKNKIKVCYVAGQNIKANIEQMYLALNN